MKYWWRNFVRKKAGRKCCSVINKLYSVDLCTLTYLLESYVCVYLLSQYKFWVNLIVGLFLLGIQTGKDDKRKCAPIWEQSNVNQPSIITALPKKYG